MRVRIACLVVLTTIVVSCGGSSTSDSSTTTTFNDADVMFAQMMIPHHEQAIELADMALDPTVGASSDVTALAGQIKAAQDPEIDQMKASLTSWGEPLTDDSGMDHGSMMGGMLDVDELDAIGALTGSEFDTAWIEAMIAHHEGAIDMAEEVLADGTDPGIKALAEAIISAQTAEIEMLEELLAR